MMIRTLIVLLTLALMAPPTFAEQPDFSPAETLINQAVADKLCPGAVLLVGRKEGVVYEKALGNRAVQPSVEAMTTDTIFDVASLSKPIGTATSVLILIDRNKI